MVILAWRVDLTKWGSPVPEVAEYDRETASCYFDAKGHKILKRSSSLRHFDVLEEAIDCAERIIDMRLSQARDAVSKMGEAKAKVVAMKREVR